MLDNTPPPNKITGNTTVEIGNEPVSSALPLSFNDRLVQYIGVDSYIEAGGEITINSDISYCDDAALVRALALKKLQAKALYIQSQGWGWVKYDIDFPYHLAKQLPRIKAKNLPCTTDYDLEINKLENEIWALEQQSDHKAANSNGAPAQRFEVLVSKQNQLFAERQEYIVLNAEWDPEEKANAGCILAVNQIEGILEIQAGFVERDSTD